MVKATCKLSSVLDANGLDIYFLNRPSIHKVTDYEKQIAPVFLTDPSGYTPLAGTLAKVLEQHAEAAKYGKLLIMIVTDGAPTDSSGQPDTFRFRKLRCTESVRLGKVLAERNPISNIHVTFIACTDDEDALRYMDEYDTKIRNVDTVSTYAQERAQILRVPRNRGMRFTYMDYIVKALVGSIDPELDNLDEDLQKCPSSWSLCIIA